MNVGIIGNNLTSMTLAKALVNKKVKVTIFYKASLKKVKTNRCIGITSNNLDFFNKKIFKVNKKFLKPINEIKIYLESNLKKETLSFKKNNTSLLNTIKIKDLFLILKRELNYKKNFNEKKVKSYDFLIKNKNYDLIFNCEKRNSLIEKYFYQAHVKDYKSKAITCNLNHKKMSKVILITGASGSMVSDLIEADLIEMYLLKIGIPKKDIIKETKSKNTYENAQFSEKVILKIANKNNPKCLVITSEYHMRRSMACFYNTELNVYAFTKRTDEKYFDIESFLLPQSNILYQWKILFHEIIGYYTYKIVGYI